MLILTARVISRPKNCHNYCAQSTHTHTHTHTYPFNGPLPEITKVSRYQKGKTNLDFTEARDNEWQWHQLDHVQVCTSFQIDNHTSAPSLSLLQAIADALPGGQRTESNCSKMVNDQRNALVATGGSAPRLRLTIWLQPIP